MNIIITGQKNIGKTTIFNKTLQYLNNYKVIQTKNEDLDGIEYIGIQENPIAEDVDIISKNTDIDIEDLIYNFKHNYKELKNATILKNISL